MMEGHPRKSQEGEDFLGFSPVDEVEQHVEQILRHRPAPPRTASLIPFIRSFRASRCAQPHPALLPMLLVA